MVIQRKNTLRNDAGGLGLMAWVGVKRDGFVKKVLCGGTEIPLIWISAIGNPMKLGMVQEKIDSLHPSSLLLVGTMGISESPVPLFVSTGGSELIPLMRKRMEFSGGDVGTQ